jgi:hypothetical protein
LKALDTNKQTQRKNQTKQTNKATVETAMSLIGPLSKTAW